MTKRKTLVKNKRKKRQTKKRQTKKYIGGDINEILKILETNSPLLKKKIENCLRPGAICYTDIFPIIRKEKSLDANKQRELTVLIGNIVQKNAELREKVKQEQELELKEQELKEQELELQEQERKNKILGSQHERNKRALRLFDLPAETDTERLAIEKFEGRTDAWNEIQKLLTMECNRREESGGLQLGDSKNYQTQGEALANIASAQSLLSTLQTDGDFFEKKKFFYTLLYNFGINCHQFKHVQNLALRDCLNYDCYQIISSITKQNYSNYSLFLTYLNSNNKYYYNHIFTNSNSDKMKTDIWIFLLDIELIVDLILNLHQKIVFNLDDALKPNTIKTTGSFLLNLLSKFLNSSLYKFNSIEISRTWEEDLKSLVNIIFESVYEVTKRLTKYNATFLVKSYSTLVNNHILKTLEISCKILTFKRQWYGENKKNCDEKIKNDKTYLKIKNFMESVLQAITTPGSKITPL